MLVARDAAPGVLARYLSALKIERIAVAVVRRVPEHGDAAIVLDPPALHAHGDVAPHQVLALAAPGRPFGPHPAGPQTVYRSVVDAKVIERRINRDHVRIRIADGLR